MKTPVVVKGAALVNTPLVTCAMHPLPKLSVETMDGRDTCPRRHPRTLDRGSMALLSCSRCQRCGAATRFFLVNLQEAVLMCSMQEVRRALRRPETTSQPLTHFCFFGIHFLSASQCVWPLDVVGEIDEVCLPASDPRVKSFTAAAAAHEPELPPPAAQQQVSSSSDELQHISNMLFQPSPACSPAVHGAAHYRLPTGDSLPASTT